MSTKTSSSQGRQAHDEYPPFGNKRHLGNAAVVARFPGQSTPKVVANVPCNIHTMIPPPKQKAPAGSGTSVKVSLPPSQCPSAYCSDSSRSPSPDATLRKSTQTPSSIYQRYEKEEPPSFYPRFYPMPPMDMPMEFAMDMTKQPLVPPAPIDPGDGSMPLMPPMPMLMPMEPIPPPPPFAYGSADMFVPPEPMFVPMYPFYPV
uniref:ARAD1D26972p n=1 Tax=Blastobotrys adeninivorans TaxID=409370 RepID=A0A060TAH1_BLAAD